MSEGKARHQALPPDVRTIIVKALGVALGAGGINEDEWTRAWTWADETWLRQLNEPPGPRP